MSLPSNQVIVIAAATDDASKHSALASRAFGARISNIVMTAQIQTAHAAALATCDRARRTCSYIECVWPQTPLRTIVLSAYRSQMHAAEREAANVLAHARLHCGLAFAH